MGQFKDASIKEVIEELNQVYFLPDIQREYVWLSNKDDKKIEKLFDSILRGYPIGSFLFWKLNKDVIETSRNAEKDPSKLNFQLYKFIENYDERNPHNEKINIEQINANDLSIVLDGQQRLTSLYVGLKGTRTLRKPYGRQNNPDDFEEKRLYINLRYQPREERPDDDFKFEFHKENTLPKNDEANFWFKVGDILNIEDVPDFVEEKELSNDEARILKKLKDAFCKKHLISYFEETDKKLDKVLKIFIRVNSGGTQLSYSDLLMSILTANFPDDIRGSMNEFIDSIADQGFSIMGRDQVLKTCLLLTESNHIFQLKNFSKSNINKIETNWGKIKEAIFEAIKLLREFGYAEKRLSSAYTLSAIAYFIFTKGQQKAQTEKNEILQFVRSAQITSYFTTSLDNKLEIVAGIVRDSENFKDINEKLASSKVQPLKISENDIEQWCDYKYGNPAIFPILQLLYPHLDFKNSIFHIDHIYPKSKFNDKNKDLPIDYQGKGKAGKADFLYNLQLLEGGENLEKRAKAPEEWLKGKYGSDSSGISSYKEKNYIPKDFVLRWEHIADFEKQRSERIITELKVLLLKNP